MQRSIGPAGGLGAALAAGGEGSRLTDRDLLGSGDRKQLFAAAAASATRFCLDAMSESLADILFSARRRTAWSGPSISNTTGWKIGIIPGTGRHALWGLVQHPRECGALLLIIDFEPQLSAAGQQRMRDYHRRNADILKGEPDNRSTKSAEGLLLSQIAGQDGDLAAITGDPTSYRPAQPGDPIRRISLVPIEVIAHEPAAGLPKIIAKPGAWGRDTSCAKFEHALPAKAADRSILRNMAFIEIMPASALDVAYEDGEIAPAPRCEDARVRMPLQAAEAMSILSDFIPRLGADRALRARATRLATAQWRHRGTCQEAAAAEFGLTMAQEAGGSMTPALVDKIHRLAIECTAEDFSQRLEDILCLRAWSQNANGKVYIDGSDSFLTTDRRTDDWEGLSLHQLGKEYRISFVGDTLVDAMRVELHQGSTPARHLGTFLLDEAGTLPSPGPNGTIARMTDRDFRHFNSAMNAVDEAYFVLGEMRMSTRTSA